MPVRQEHCQVVVIEGSSLSPKLLVQILMHCSRSMLLLMSGPTDGGQPYLRSTNKEVTTKGKTVPCHTLDLGPTKFMVISPLLDVLGLQVPTHYCGPSMVTWPLCLSSQSSRG